MYVDYTHERTDQEKKDKIFILGSMSDYYHK